MGHPRILTGGLLIKSVHILNAPVMYAPYHNTFYVRGTCSQPTDPCGADTDCLPSCVQPENRTPMTCVGSDYKKARNMGMCYPRYAQPGDACVVGEYPDCNSHLVRQPGLTGLVTALALDQMGIPPMYCQQTLNVDSRPNSAPTYAAPYVGEGFCAPSLPFARPPVNRSKTFSWIQ